MSSAASTQVSTQNQDPNPATIIPACLAATLSGGALALLAWWVLEQTSFPAFNTSMFTRAVGTACLALFLALLGTALWFHRAMQHEKHRAPTLITHALCYLAPAAVVITSLAIPLAATDLYLDGIQVDQGFRTQFLTRMTDTAANADMNYAGLPSYYPIAWFWLGGRLANLLNLAGWAVYQPWALTSLAMAASLLVPVWQRITRSLPTATAIALVTVSIAIVTSGDEVYGAVVAMFTPAAIALTPRALGGSKLASAGLILILGTSATFYTLFTGVAALAVVAVAFLLAITQRSWLPLLRLLAIGLASIAIALLSWGPYLWLVLSGHPTSAAAMHYLPGEGTKLALPFFSGGLLGTLCLVGLIYLIVRIRQPLARSLAIGLIVMYAWALASMLVTVVGTTLLGFRLEVLITIHLASAGVLGLIDAWRCLSPRLPAERRQAAAASALVLALAGGVGYAQSIPLRLQDKIDQAYTDTDGSGKRADQYPPDVVRYYGQIDQYLRAQGHGPGQTVLFSDETRFFSYYPYHGFNAFTAHYANPLGEFEARNAQLEKWAKQSWEELAKPEDFARALDASPWSGPDAFLFRATAEDKEWKIHIAEDIYPSQPNVRFIGLKFNPEVFSEGWSTKEIGPYLVVTRNR